MHTGGIILCGGESTRMGTPKAWLSFGRETLLARVARIMSEAVRPIIVVAAPGQDVPPLPREIEIVRDRNAGCGPLEGIATGLKVIAERADAAFVASCDLPLLQAAFVRHVVAQLDDAHVAAVPRVAGFPQPLAGVYRTALCQPLDERIAAGRLSVRDFLATIPTRWLDDAELRAVDPELQSLVNINCPADYEAALRRVKE